MEEEGEKNDNSLDLNSLLHAPVNFFFARQSWLARSMFKGSFFFPSSVAVDVASPLTVAMASSRRVNSLINSDGTGARQAAETKGER